MFSGLEKLKKPLNPAQTTLQDPPQGPAKAAKTDLKSPRRRPQEHQDCLDDANMTCKTPWVAHKARKNAPKPPKLPPESVDLPPK